MPAQLIICCANCSATILVLTEECDNGPDSGGLICGNCSKAIVSDLAALTATLRLLSNSVAAIPRGGTAPRLEIAIPVSEFAKRRSQ